MWVGITRWGPSNVGLTSNDPDTVPLILSTGSTVAWPAANATSAATATITGAANAPFGNDGVAVGYKDMSSAFCAAASAGATFNVSSASLTPIQAYTNLTP